MADGSGGEYAAGQAVAADQGGAAADGGCAECHTGNWVHVRYEYTEGDPITDATFVVQTPNDGQPGGTVLHEGVLSIGPNAPHEFIHVDLGSHDGPVEVFFFDDPTEPAPFEEPAPVEDTRSWLRRAADAVVDGASWVGEVGMGDFNEEMSTGQIITNAVVTAIPVVDQVADARDLVANGKYLLWDRRYNEIGVWVGVFACLIGLVPSLGSLAKGVIKVIWKNAGEIGRVIIYINRAFHRTGVHINGYRKVKEIGDALVGQVAEVAARFDEFLDDCAAKARLLGMTDLLATIDRVRGMARQKFNEVATEISARITRGLAEFATTAWRLFPGQSIVVRRTTVIARRTYESWQSTMTRIGFDKNALEAGSEPLDDATDAFMRGAIARATRWRSELLSDPNLPPSLRTYLQDDVGGYATKTLTTFKSRPSFIDFEKNPQTLYRVTDRPDKVTGPFWSRAEPPSDEATWRSQNAVLNGWNDAGAYVSATMPPPPAALVGEIGPQISEADPNMMLRGGGEQVVFPGQNPVPESQIRQYFHTDWNDRAPVSPTRATSQAGRISECDK